MPNRVPDPSELAEDLARIEAAVERGNNDVARRLDELSREISKTYVRQDVYDARHNALRSEIALEFAATKATQHGVEAKADSARGLSMWALGLICTAVVIALVGFLVNAAGGAT